MPCNWSYSVLWQPFWRPLVTVGVHIAYVAFRTKLWPPACTFVDCGTWAKSSLSLEEVYEVGFY